MPKIISHGTRPENKPPYTLAFTCASCGCRFKPETGDKPVYHQGDDRPYNSEPGYWSLACPEPWCHGQGRATERSEYIGSYYDR